MRPKTTMEIPPAPMMMNPILLIAACGVHPHWSMARVVMMVSSKTKLQRKEK